MLSSGVGVVEQVNRISGAGFPTEHLQESRTLDVNNSFVVTDPTDRVMKEAQQVSVAGKPIGTLDVSREPHGSAWSGFAENDCGLASMRLGWISEFGRIAYKTGNYGEQRLFDGPEGRAILCAREPCCVVEAIQQRMRLGRACRFNTY